MVTVFIIGVVIGNGGGGGSFAWGLLTSYPLAGLLFVAARLYQAHAAGKPLDGVLRNVLAEATDAVSTLCSHVRPGAFVLYVRGTLGVRVLYVPEAQGSLAPRPHALYVRRTAPGLGRAVLVKTYPVHRGTLQVSTERSTARLTPMASTDQTIASPTFTPMATPIAAPIASPWQPSAPVSPP